MQTCSDWRGRPVQMAESLGHPPVRALANPMANLLHGDVSPWPPAELVQKMRRSERLSAFDPVDQRALSDAVGFYTNLQSLHSEDAIVWSVFGLLVYADAATRLAVANALLDAIQVPVRCSSAAVFWLWRKIPHPQKPSAEGPELDFAMAADSLLLVGEAKWLSPVSKKQGIARDQDQVTLRRLFLKDHGLKIYDSVRTMILLTVSRSGGLQTNQDTPLADRMLYLRDVTWNTLSRLPHHPAGDELIQYLDWKVRYSRLA